MNEASSAALIWLTQVSHTATLEELPQLISAHAARAGLRDMAVFVVDVREKVLRWLTGKGPDAGAGGERFSVEGSLPGRAYQRGDVLTEHGAGGGEGRPRWWVAVTDGVERLGVLRADTDTEDEAVRESLRHWASMTALLLLSKRSFSDSYARLLRT